MMIVATVLIACGTNKEKVSGSPTAKGAQTKTKQPVEPEVPPKAVQELTKDISGNLSGLQTKASFMQAPFNSWFTPRYEAYSPDEATVESLKEQMKDVEIRAYMGTWCGDSKRETPNFYKLLDTVNFDLDQLDMITVDRTKSKPTELVDGYDINRVPTFIFYRDGEELGRYVEYARESLEKDVLKIVSNQEYKHSYQQ